MRGRHRRPSRTASLITTAATGTLTASAIAVSAVPGAQAATLPVPASTTLNLPPVHAQVNSIREALPRTVTVENGDTLSQIAADHCGNPADWTGIWRANESKIPDWNLIYKGQVLLVACKTASLPVVAAVTSVTLPAKHHSYQAPVSAPVHETDVSTAGMGGFQSCVIRAESGGNSQIWNASGHYGLYQFSSSTWAAHGGPPGDFGHASAAEQTQIFWNTVHEDGTSDWAPYDGC